MGDQSNNRSAGSSLGPQRRVPRSARRGSTVPYRFADGRSFGVTWFTRTVTHFDVIEYLPDAYRPGEWNRGTPTGNLPIGLAFTLACTGMGLPIAAPLRYEVLEAQVELVSKLVECPPTGPLRRHDHFRHASLNVRRLCSESVGLAIAAALAYYEHGWTLAHGWPRDLDLPPLTTGARPDLLFAVPGGQVAAEARGRSQARHVYTVTADQLRKLHGIERWSAANGNIKTFMAWSWITTDSTRTDYFDPGEPRVLVDSETLEANLRERCRRLRQSARQLELAEHRIGDENVLGEWIRPARRDFEFFLGVRDPDAIEIGPATTQRPSADTETSPDGPGAVVGAIITAVRPLGKPVNVADLVAIP
jgi:hypothetical protein